MLRSLARTALLAGATELGAHESEPPPKPQANT